ncbi:MAG: PIN domain-containing protein [Terrimicrobiaceae bacterium]|nr:PIN domain-containing protein [Terrimicrobiaceae bacterium]
MILPDANLLLYAYDRSSPWHKAAAGWWSECLSGEEPIAIAPVVLFAFVRVATSPRAYDRPMKIETAASHVREWLDQPPVEVADLQPADVDLALHLLCGAGIGGNLTTDAQIAALSVRLRGEVHTADSDFARFPSVRWRNPLTKRTSR